MDLINQLKKQKDVLTTWSNRLISLPIQFIIMPMTMIYLGIESYAFYLVLSGLINWFYMSDFSFGLILQNMIGQYQNDKQKLNQVIGYSFITMCILLIGWSILILLSSPIISNLLLKNYFINNTTLRSSAFILISVLALINSLFTKCNANTVMLLCLLVEDDTE
jgi:O-antigen/teichoic acid export membrane protein